MVKEQQQQKQANKTAIWCYPTSIFIQEQQVQLMLEPPFVLRHKTDRKQARNPGLSPGGSATSRCKCSPFIIENSGFLIQKDIKG